MRCVVLTLFCAFAALAQHVVSVAQLPPAVNGFNAAGEHAALPCSVEPIKPALDFRFRFQAGYQVRTSMDAYAGGRHHWSIVFRVTPEGGSPVYFLDSEDLPEPQGTGFEAVASGLFVLGEGRYEVKWSLLDDSGRVCRKEWPLDVRPDRTERSVRVAMPPGTVGDLTWHPAIPLSVAAPDKPRRITVLLNAALPRRGLFTAFSPPEEQWGQLLSMLAALPDSLPGCTLRLIVFDSEQQKEVFREDDFRAVDMEKVAHAAGGAARWAVDYHILQKPQGAWDLVRGLEQEEIHAAEPPDAVIFMGLQGTAYADMHAGLAELKAADAPHLPYPRFVYLRCIPTPHQGTPTNWRLSGEAAGIEQGGRGGGRGIAIQLGRSGFPNALQADVIEQTVQRLKGKTIAISSPGGFSKAIAGIEHGSNR